MSNATKRLKKINAALAATSLLWLSTLPVALNAEENGNEVIVSASRIPVPANQVGSAVTVITQDDIKNSQATTIGDLLRTVPGLAFSQTGSRGGMSQVRIRGAEGNHTLVVIDGIEMNDPARSSEFDFSHLLLSNIERIEVVRGPQSALYGSDSIGGLILIRTKTGAAQPETTTSLSYGTYNTTKVLLSTRGGNRRFNYSLGALHYTTDGFSTASEKRGATEKDGYKNDSINLNLNMSPNEITVFSLYLKKTRAEADTDGFTGGIGAVDANNTDKIDKLSGRVSAKIDLFDGRWTHKLNYSVARNDIDSFSNGLATFLTRGKKQKFDYQNSFVFGNTDGHSEHKLVTAFERETDQMFSSFSGGKRTVTNLGYVAEYRYSYRKKLFSSLALRFDDNDIFKNASTGRVTLAYLPGRSTRHRLHTSYGTGVKNPTLFELFGFTATFNGNPNLSPEKARGWDAGIESHFFNRRLKVDLTYFDKDITDLITGAGNTAINLSGTSKSRGIEFTSRWRASERLWLAANYTYTRAKTANGEQQIRRPRHQFTVQLNYQPVSSTNIYLSYTAKSDIKDYAFDAFFNRTLVPLDDYAVVNLAVRHKLSKRFALTARVENLFDEDYEEVYTYGTSGRAFYVGVSARF